MTCSEKISRKSFRASNIKEVGPTIRSCEPYSGPVSEDH